MNCRRNPVRNWRPWRPRNYRRRHPVIEQQEMAGAASASFPTIFIEFDHAHHSASYRAEHGRQVDLLAADGVDRDSRADGIVRAGPLGAAERGRSRFYPHRRQRQSCAWTIDLHGRDDRNRSDFAHGNSALADIARRSGPRTSTYDGLAIAWAAIEIPARPRARENFICTHYFELTELAEQLSE